MTILKSDVVAITTGNDVVLARQAVRKLTQELAFSLVDQTKFVTAASELARNTLIHGKGGTMQWQTLAEGARKGIRLIFRDEGPGIANMELALTDGWTSGSGLGHGLPGSKRMVDEFSIESEPGRGTTVTITRWK
jgi:serine/threonine-protein kinase RsbT